MNNLSFLPAALMSLSALCGIAACSESKAKSGEEIFLADPTVFVENGKYYLTGTQGDSNKGFIMYESTDLENWTPSINGGNILTPGDSTFGDKGFWAPQIYKDGNTYYFAYTANEQTVLAKSDTITGPFRQDSIRPIDGSEKNIDPYIFNDNGKYYLYHVRFDHGNYLWVAEFDLKTGNIDKSTLTKCFGLTDKWEKTDNGKWDPIMEGPTVIKKDGKYYMLYSANHFENADYAVGYAVADSPMGPWVKNKNNPIIHRTIVGENGSGHGDIFTGLDGKPYYVYHIHNSDSAVGPRRTRIVPLIFNKNEETGIYDISVDSKHIIIPHITK